MNKSPITKIVFTTVIALLVPIFTYTIFQFVQSDKNEELIKSIYDRQLGSILFSVNQHCWDMFMSWYAEINTLAESFTRHSYGRLKSGLYAFNNSKSSISGSFVWFSNQFVVYALDQESTKLTLEAERAEFRNKLNSIILDLDKEIDKQVKRAQQGYIKPLAVTWQNNPQARETLLIFPIVNNSYSNENVVLAGIIVDDLAYIHDIVARKFGSMNDGNLIFAVKDDSKIIFATDDAYESDYEKYEELWILPDLDIQIKLAGTTLAELSKSRSRTNLVLLVIVNVVFLGGLGYLFYNVTTEISLAKMKTSFVANVSHELRTPLALIRMFAETLEMGRVNSEEKKQHYYKTIMSESARLSQLINNILDFSKIESRKKEYKFEQSNLIDLIEQTLELYHFRFTQNGFKVEKYFEPNIPLVYIDKEAITQAFVNLLDNAVKYSFDEKFIKVSVVRQNGSVEMSVQDKGIGIQESEQSKIFEKFYRAGNSLVHNTKGSGLGLSLVKHIIDVHGGKIWVSSKPKKGSTFTCAFPLN